jgi:hypothetical protein
MPLIKSAALSLGLVTAIFAAFSSSTNYRLNSYGVGPGGTSNSGSTTYKLQGSAGEQANGSTNDGTNYAKNGSIQTEQLNVPPAPTLSNGSGTYYNKLNVIVSAGGNPADTTFSVAVATGSCNNSPLYVQASGALGATQVYQTYSTWYNSGNGTFITGLANSTTYYVNAAAKQGLFTNTEFGACASAATVSTSTTFSVAPNTITLSNLLPGSVITSSNLTIGFATNGAAGGAVYVSGAHSGLLSNLQSHTIAAYTGNLATPSEGFGIQATNPAQTSGGPLTTVSPYNGTGNTVGTESTVPAQILSTVDPIVGGSAYANFQAKASTATPASADYQETLTFIAAGNF